MNVFIGDKEQAPISEEQKWLQAILNAAGDGIIAIDEKGRMLSFNPAAERIFGYTPDEVLGKNVSMLAAPPDDRKHDSYLSAYLKTGDAKIIGREREVVAKRKDGTLVPIGLMVSEVFFGNRRRFIGITRDITQRKQIEEELAKYRNRLEELVQERTQALESSHQQLRVAEKMASIGELAAKIAHEIKNPLTGIYAAIQLLEKGIPSSDPKREIYENVSQEIRRLDDTVQDLLRFARPVPPQKIQTEMDSFLRELVESLKRQPEVARHQVRVQVPEGLIVPLDPKLMGQVFSNLILNASQSMDSKGKINISAKKDKEKKNVLIEVADTGPGISPEVLPSIFDPFFTTKVRGTGLGLPISKKNIEAHGGKISVETQLGQGTRFFVTLPVAAPAR